TAQGLDKALRSLGEYGYKIVQRITLQIDGGWIDRLVADVKTHGAHEVWIRLPINRGEEIKDILHALRHFTVEVRYMPDLGDLPLINHQISNIAGMYSIDISCSPIEGPARIVKRLEDIFIGSIISIFILPVCV